jgi:Fur family peroxide stress response transcriptional regulator
MERLREALKQAGVKLTHQRLEVYKELAQSVDHPDAETLFRRLRERLPTISLDTVYRTLWLLLDLGLINTLGQSRIGTKFDANLDSHHHFICSVCGMARDLYSEEFDGLQAPLSVKSYGKAQTTHVEVRGVCFQCAGKDSPGRTET